MQPTPPPNADKSFRRSRIQSLVALLVASGIWWWLRGWVPGIILGLAAVLALLAWAAPAWHAPVQRVLDRAAHVLAAAVTWLLLGMVFLGVFVPLRFWRWMSRQDPLALRSTRARPPAADAPTAPLPGATTYLSPLPRPEPRRFERMY